MKKTKSKSEIQDDIKNRMVPQDFNKPFEELKKDIYANYKKGGSGSSDRFYGKQGYSIFYTDNNNFMQGTKNGGGAGYFAVLQYVGMTSTIKIS